MVWAISHTGGSLFTQNNDNLSLLEVSNISLVVLLVKKKKKIQVQNMMATHKVADSFGLCVRDTICAV